MTVRFCKFVLLQKKWSLILHDLHLSVEYGIKIDIEKDRDVEGEISRGREGTRMR